MQLYGTVIRCASRRLNSGSESRLVAPLLKSLQLRKESKDRERFYDVCRCQNKSSTVRVDVAPEMLVLSPQPIRRKLCGLFLHLGVWLCFVMAGDRGVLPSILSAQASTSVFVAACHCRGEINGPGCVKVTRVYREALVREGGVK